MLAQVRKFIAPEGRSELAGRLGAWWDGRDYVPPPPPEPQKIVIDVGDGKRGPVELPPSAAMVQRSQSKQQLRMKALTLVWGPQRFAPGSETLDSRLLDLVFDTANQAGALGFIGADPALMNACRSRTDRGLFAAEWRAGCVEAGKKMVSGIVVSPADIDRPLCFTDRKIEGMVSIDAFAYADHKPGLASRVHRALSGTGKWVFLDLVRNTPKAPAAAFASGWAEPQLATADEIDAILRATGYVAVRREDATPHLIKAARRGIAGLGAALDEAMKAGMDGTDGAVVLQEVAWEVQTWQARMRALEGGALSAHIWIADKDPALRGSATSAAASRPAAAKPKSAAPAAPVEGKAEAQSEAPKPAATEAEPPAADADGHAEAPDLAAGEGAMIAPPVGASKKTAKIDQSAVDALFD